MSAEIIGSFGAAFRAEQGLLSDPQSGQRFAADIVREYSVRIAFGTGSLDKDTRGDKDVIIESQSDIDECGLAKATRFDLEDTATVSWEPPECDCWRGRYTPVLGSLPMSQEIDCAYKLAAIQNKNASR